MSLAGFVLGALTVLIITMGQDNAPGRTKRVLFSILMVNKCETLKPSALASMLAYRVYYVSKVALGSQ